MSNEEPRGGIGVAMVVLVASVHCGGRLANGSGSDPGIGPEPNDADGGTGKIDGGMEIPRDAGRTADRPVDIRRSDASVDTAVKIVVSDYCKNSGFSMCEDFEGGGIDPAVWTMTSGGVTAQIDTTRAAAGSKHAFHVKGNPKVDGGNMTLLARQVFPIKGQHLFIRAFVYVASPFPQHHTATMSITDVTMPDAPYGPYTFQFYPSDQGVGGGNGPIPSFWGAAGEQTGGSSIVPFNRWSCVEWEILAADTVELHGFLDEREMTDLKVVAQSGWRPPANGQPRFQFHYGLGEPVVPPPQYEYWIDQIAVDHVKIGCTR